MRNRTGTDGHPCLLWWFLACLGLNSLMSSATSWQLMPPHCLMAWRLRIGAVFTPCHLNIFGNRRTNIDPESSKLATVPRRWHRFFVLAEYLQGSQGSV
ncbi:uncharacterized protein B0T23DRAFT_377182 [Neurospora hispaniola]|uniref:Secreted protein n=1 Tax=Neurospora hispaniola TaxID=588809 RepID=A0AAJ0I9V6_9PEZI|nr:hypothetical protein B0T23DRAFT_377182 [Neurospora hispaniola]